MAFLKILIILVIRFLVICAVLFFIQEKLIFFPERLHKDYKFDFDQNFEELTIKGSDGVLLNGVLFKTSNPKGLIFYLHGNAGSLRTWGEIAETYTSLNYDLFMLDYRGFGKSAGYINSERQLY